MKIIKFICCLFIAVIFVFPLIMYTIKLPLNIWGWFLYVIYGGLIGAPIDEFNKWFDSKLK